MRECIAIKYTLTEYEFSILGSKHPTVLFTDHKPILFLFTQKSNPNRRVFRLKTDIGQSQINDLQLFPLYLDCQNNHYEVDLLGKSSFQPIPYSPWIKNNTQQKLIKQNHIKQNYSL